MKLILILIPLFVLAIVGCGYKAHSWHKLPVEEKAAKMEKKIAKELDLNESQKNQLHLLVQATVQDVKQFKQDHEAIHQEFKVQAEAENFDPTQLKSLSDSKLEAAKTLKNNVLDRIAEFHKSLNPEQKKELQEHMDKHMKRWETHGSGHHKKHSS